MLDILTTLRSVDGTATDHSPRCAWQDRLGRTKRDTNYKEVPLTVRYTALLRQLQDGAPAVVETLNALADKVAGTDATVAVAAARDARVASGWLARLSRRDFATSAWDADYSQLDGYWVCLRDALVGLEQCFLLRSSRTTEDTGAGPKEVQRQQVQVIRRYVDELAELQGELDGIESARTTLAQKVVRQVAGTMAALRGVGGGAAAVLRDEDDGGFWDEESVGSSVR